MTAPLKVGDISSAVVELKSLLNLAIDAKLTVNNRFDQQTDTALKRFQKANQPPLRPTGRADEATLRKLESQAIKSLQTAFNQPRAIPKWLKVAMDEKGTREFPTYSRNNPRILEYWRTCSYMVNATSGPFFDHRRQKAKGLFDETSWCGAFVTWVMVKTGFKRGALPYYGSNALAWANWGCKVTTHPIPDGAIVVVRDKKNSDPHVGFYAGNGTGRLVILGGNQRQPGIPVSREANGIMVSEVDYTGMFRVEDYRWPSKNIIPESCKTSILVDAFGVEINKPWTAKK